MQIQSVLSSELEGDTLWKELRIKEKAEPFVAFENFGNVGEVKEARVTGNSQTDYIHIWENHVHMEMEKEYEDFNGIKLKAETDGIHVYNKEYQYVLGSMPRLNAEIDERFLMPPSVSLRRDDIKRFEIFYRTYDKKSLPFWKHQLF